MDIRINMENVYFTNISNLSKINVINVISRYIFKT